MMVPGGVASDSYYSTEKDIVRHFALSSIAVRPEASQIIVARLAKLGNSSLKKAYLERMIKNLKEKHSMHVGTLGPGNAGSLSQLMLD